MGIHVVNRSKGNEVAGTAVGDVLLREFKHGLHQLVGTRIVAAIEVSESVLQEALQHVRGIPCTMTVSVTPANRIIVGYGAFHATAVLAPMMDPRAPRIELELRSTILAWGLQRAINIPAVSVSAGAWRSTSIVCRPSPTSAPRGSISALSGSRRPRDGYSCTLTSPWN